VRLLRDMQRMGIRLDAVDGPPGIPGPRPDR
jgi:hypothetical protein